jgi:hypothetical protein
VSSPRRPPPPIPPIDGSLLGKPPRSMLIECAMHDFGLSRYDAAKLVDDTLKRLGTTSEVDNDR